MSVPPSFGDLGKSAKDLFGKGFNYGTHKLEVKTKSQVGAEFKTTASSNHDSGKFSGNLETKYKCCDTGLTFVEKWNTDNQLGAEVNMEDRVAKGLKMTFEGTFAPQTGKKSGKIKTQYKREYFNGSCDLDVDIAGPTIHGSAVTEYKGWLLGYQVSFDTSKSKLGKSNLVVGYKGTDLELNTTINDGSEFGGSVFNKVNPKTDVGIDLAWTAGSNSTKFGVAAKYTPSRCSVYRAKINNASQIGLSYQHTLRDGVTLTTSTLLEAKNFNAGGHKVGLGFEFEL